MVLFFPSFFLSYSVYLCVWLHGSHDATISTACSTKDQLNLLSHPCLLSILTFSPVCLSVFSFVCFGPVVPVPHPPTCFTQLQSHLTSSDFVCLLASSIYLLCPHHHNQPLSTLIYNKWIIVYSTFSCSARWVCINTNLIMGLAGIGVMHIIDSPGIFEWRLATAVLLIKV